MDTLLFQNYHCKLLQVWQTILTNFISLRNVCCGWTAYAIALPVEGKLAIKFVSLDFSDIISFIKKSNNNNNNNNNNNKRQKAFVRVGIAT